MEMGEMLGILGCMLLWQVLQSVLPPGFMTEFRCQLSHLLEEQQSSVMSGVRHGDEMPGAKQCTNVRLHYCHLFKQEGEWRQDKVWVAPGGSTCGNNLGPCKQHSCLISPSETTFLLFQKPQ